MFNMFIFFTYSSSAVLIQGGGGGKQAISFLNVDLNV